jgi:nucleotide-binding universal stress UspA family protein
VAARSDPVVVGVDGAPRSLPAVRWGAREAQVTGRQLRLVHATEPAVVLASGWSADPWSLPRPEVARIATRALFDEAGAVARAAAPGVPIDERSRSGRPIQVLMDAARFAYLLVLGPHGASVGGNVVLGSVSAELLARAACPVVVVRQCRRGRGTEESAAPVVVGVDGSPDSSAAAVFAADLAGRHAVPLRLVSAWRMSRIPGSGSWSQQREPQRQALDTVRADVRREHPRLVTETELVEGSAADVLVRQSLRARLLVVGSRGYGSEVDLLLGSVSQTVARTAYCPVTVHHRLPASAAPADGVNRW